MSAAVKILHITDHHLFANSNNTLADMPCNITFEDTIDLAYKTHYDADLLLLTGDISQDYSPESYDFFLDKIKIFSCPKLLTGGNHDVVALLKQLNNCQSILVNGSIQLGKWFFIMLDSMVAGRTHGLIAESEIERLHHHVLQAQKLKIPHITVGMHHHLLPCKTKWLDNIAIKNADTVLTELAKYSNIRLVCYGHIHQIFEKTINHTLFMASPSTCFQFAKKQKKFKLAADNPGFRIIYCHSDGHITSEILQIQNKKYPLDIHCEGY